MRKSALVSFLATFILITAAAHAGIRPLEQGEEIVYQTVQSGSNYRTFPPFVSQITGNAYTEYGDEVLLGGTAGYITNIAVGTQTFSNPNTPAYMDGVNQSGGADPVDTGGFLELSIYINDGPLDVAGDVQFVDSTPENMPQPQTLVARTRIPTPSYPQGGVSPSANGQNDLNNPNDNANDPWIVEFAFPNVYLPPNRDITFAMVNLNRFGVPDGHNSDGNQFGVWHALAAVGSLAQPSTGGPFYYGTNYNTNVVGTSRTGPNNNRFTDNGEWTWYEYSNKWESTRASNNAVESTMYAAFNNVLGDMNGDGFLDNFDIEPFEMALTDQDGFTALYQRWWEDTIRRGDIDQDGSFDNFDIQPFEDLLTGGGSSPAAVPEPAAFWLLGLGGLALAARRRWAKF